MTTDQSLTFDSIVLFGDSITQQAWGYGGLGAALANAYQRKRDVFNRGLSGYNTAWALPIAKQWLPRVGESRPTTSLLLIWFGANDAALPPSPQALTIPEFKANLHSIIQLLTLPESPYYSPTTKFLLLTPPPVDAFTRNTELVSRVPPRVPDRDSERTRAFAEAVKEVAIEAGVPSVDTWNAITDAAARDGGLDKYLVDGLHLSAAGYQVVTNGVAEVIQTHLPELHWDKLEQIFPHWSDIVNHGALGPQYLEKNRPRALLRLVLVRMSTTTAQPPRQHSVLASLLAGSVGGASQVLVGQPLDTIKTRAQTAAPGAFRGPMDIARQTIKKEGFLALYKGMASPLLGVAGVNSLLFSANAHARQLISPFGPNLSIAQVALAGGIAGAVQSVLASPVEMFKIRMQAQYTRGGGKRLREVVGDMYREYGWRKGIMRGYWLTVVREIPGYAGFYAGYEFSKRGFQSHYGTHTIPVWATLTSGGLGGIAYWTACYPLDVVKSRIQLQDAPPKGWNYIADTFRQIYREEGARAFVRGITPTYIRAVPAAASTFVAFELTMELIQKHTSI